MIDVVLKTITPETSKSWTMIEVEINMNFMTPQVKKLLQVAPAFR